MWTDKTINLTNSIPSFFSDIYEYQQLFSVLDDELTLLQQTLINFKDDLFLISAGDDIISRYQNLLKTSGSTTEQKRANIIAKFSENVPFTTETLKSLINVLTNYECQLDLSIEGKITAYYKSEEIIDDPTAIYTAVYNIIPANLQFATEYLYAHYSDYLVNYYSEFTQKTWFDLKHYI